MMLNLKECLENLAFEVDSNAETTGAYWVIFLNLGWMKGNFGKIVKKIQAPAKSFKYFFLMSSKGISLDNNTLN